MADLNMDCFASGQIGSKIWLCEKWESVLRRPIGDVWILGGWYGTLAFLLLSRGKARIGRLRSFDIDPRCEPIADAVNNLWVWQGWKFKAFTADCNHLAYEEPGPWATEKPEWIINTSVEHMPSTEWWENIPLGTGVVLQSTDMDHEDHFHRFQNEDELLECFPLQEVHYKGRLYFDYQNASSFSRSMIIGIK